MCGLFRPSSGDPEIWRRVLRWPYTPKPTNGWVTTHPPVTLIPKEKCFRIVDKLPRHYHVSRKIRRPLCVRLNEAQLLQMLKDVGGYNPRYVAINREAACNFTDLSQDVEPLQRKSSQPARQKRMVSKRSTSQRRGCWSRGTFFDRSHLKRMCTECSATTKLSANIFPPFINEVKCEDEDKYCYLRRGLCKQKFLRFTFLKRTGMFERNDDLSKSRDEDVYVEKVETTEEHIKSCCECRAFPFPFG